MKNTPILSIQTLNNTKFRKEGNLYLMLIRKTSATSTFIDKTAFQVLQPCNPSRWEVKAERSGVQGHPGLHSEFKAAWVV